MRLSRLVACSNADAADPGCAQVESECLVNKVGVSELLGGALQCGRVARLRLSLVHDDCLVGAPPGYQVSERLL